MTSLGELNWQIHRYPKVNGIIFFFKFGYWGAPFLAPITCRKKIGVTRKKPMFLWQPIIGSSILFLQNL